MSSHLCSDEIQAIARKIMKDGICVLQDVTVARADEIYEQLPPALNATTKAYKHVTENNALHVDGWRHAKSKYFSTVDLRDPSVVILPHCEGTSTRDGLYGRFKLGFFYCVTPDSGGGGANVLVPTSSLPLDTRFTLTGPQLWSFCSGVTDYVFPNMPRPFKYCIRGIMYFLLKVKDIFMSLRSGFYIMDDKLLERNKTAVYEALDGKMYCSPGYDMTYYDKTLQAAFFEHLHQNSVPLDISSALAANEKSGVSRSRYRPLYSSGNDYSAALEDSLIIYPKSKQLVILDNRRWMHSASQSTKDGSRDVWAIFA